MSKNLRHLGAPNVVLPLAVDADTAAGSVITLGTDGLIGYTLTDRATTALIGEGEAAPGLADGQASVELLGVTLVVALEVDSSVSVALGDAIYVDASGDYTEDSTAATFIGWAVETILDGATGRVALANSTPASGS